MRCQCRLWAHCYAYYAAFCAFNAQRTGQTLESGYGISEKDLNRAGDLLEWAVSVDVTIRKTKRTGLPIELPVVPTNTPLPFEGVERSVLIKGSEVIFLNALAFIIHHELAHVRLGHHGVEGDLSLQQEFEADEAAARWLLGNESQAEFDYLVRHLGVAIALIWFTSIYFREKAETRTHPPAWKRLLKALEPTVRGEEDAIWGFVSIALGLHFHRHGFSMAKISEFSPTRTTVTQMIDLIETKNSELAQE